MDDEDIDFDAVGSLLLDDDNLASIFELALTDTLDLDEEEDAASPEPAQTPVNAPQAVPERISAADLETQLQAQARQPQQVQQPQQFQQPGRMAPQFNWVPPSPAWRWGMPLPMGYPPPPVALQQHMMMHHQNLQRMHHQHMQMQMQQQQFQQQQQQSKSGSQKQNNNKKASEEKVGNWVNNKIKQDEDAKALSLEEIMEAEKKAIAERGGSGNSFAEGVNVPVIVSPRKDGKGALNRTRKSRDADSRQALGSFWHGNGPLPRVDESAMMKVHEIVNIMKFQMRPLYTNDVFRDDFYFAEANARQNERVSAGLAPLPLGSYEGTSDGAVGAAPRLGLRPGSKKDGSSAKRKVRSGKIGKKMANLSVSGRENVSRARLVEKALAFQKEAKALGMHLKGSVRTPRKLLDFAVSPVRKASSSSSSSAADSDSKTNVGSAMSAPRWAARLAISRCTGLLLKLKSLESGSPLKERAGTIKLLATEIGVTPSPDTEYIALCDVESLRRIAATTKGRRMLCRALPLFNPVQMRAFLVGAMQLLPTAVASGNPQDIQASKTLQEKKEAWWKAVLDERLADVFVRGFAVALQPFPAASGQPVVELLPSAMSALLSAHSDEDLRALVKTRGGATVIQDLVARGQHFCTPHPELGPKWAELYQSFVKKVTQ